MANIAAAAISQSPGTSVVPVTAASAGGDAFDNDGRTFFVVKNAGGAGITVTFDSLVLSNFGTDVNPAPTVAAGETRIFGTFDTTRFNDANGRVGVTYSSVTSVTVMAVKG